ncbi:hypothetical protein C8R46DRAFT_1080396 [Mycena filopes]|nr:hypothetical protein C8R46DRAFT_1080396 [Mycena filopes]
MSTPFSYVSRLNRLWLDDFLALVGFLALASAACFLGPQQHRSTKHLYHRWCTDKPRQEADNGTPMGSGQTDTNTTLATIKQTPQSSALT